MKISPKECQLSLVPVPVFGMYPLSSTFSKSLVTRAAMRFTLRLSNHGKQTGRPWLGKRNKLCQSTLSYKNQICKSPNHLIQLCCTMVMNIEDHIKFTIHTSNKIFTQTLAQCKLGRFKYISKLYWSNLSSTMTF